MPSEWSWYHSVVARWSFGYWNTAEPGSQVWPCLASASCLNCS